MTLDQLIQWVDVGAWRAEQLARTVSGSGEEAEILRQIQAHLVSLKRQPMETAPRDGTAILLVTNTGVVSATYDKGHGWVDNQEGREYWGPAWVCYDDAFTIEIEETPEGEVTATDVLGWLPLPATS